MKHFFSAATAAILFASPAAQAHDFWLQPSSFNLDEPGQVDLQFVIGHDDEVTPWDLRWDRIVALRAYGRGGTSSLLASIKPSMNKAQGSASANLAAPGSYIAAFESFHSLSDLEAKRFNKYAKSEGLSAVLADRKAKEKMDTSGTELYSRRAKVLLQVGDTLDDHVTQPIGHTLEIVPLLHPASLKPGETLPVQVLFRGTPLEGALIDLTYLEKTTEPFTEARTDAQGKAEFALRESGAWKVNVIWAWANPGNKLADYETIFTSFVFELP
ncbi:MAG: DUF4198 domain-containing protein [Pseudomonadota bacterium]